jgi:hypothetical protein
MATLREERARLQFLEEHGHGDEKVHVVFIEREAAERIKNEAKGEKSPKTKFVMETDSPGMYSRLNELKDRWFSQVNKSVALSIMAELWDRDLAWIEQACGGEQQEQEASEFMAGKPMEGE